MRLGLRRARRPEGPDGPGGSNAARPEVPDRPAEAAPAPSAGGGPDAPAAGVRRRAGLLARRRLRLAIVVLAVLLPGGATVGAAMGMMPVRDGESAGPGTGLEGGLPVQDGTVEDELDPFLEPELLDAVPVGAEPVAEPVADVLSGTRVIDELGESGIPSVALDAYMRAADRLATDDPGCGIRWTLLAAIGRVESDHGWFGGARLQEDGYGTKPIRGIPLDGRPGVALIRDTDGGELDGDTTYDRAVGPMQFIPSTWASVGVDANGDGRRDPDNIVDAAQAAAVYLCDGGRDLRDPGQRAGAIRSYNNADEYMQLVLRLAETYESGRVETEPPVAGSGPPPMPEPRPTPAPPSGGSGPGGGAGSGGGPAPAPAPRPRPAPTTPLPLPTPAPRPRPAPTPAPRPTTTTAPSPTTTATVPPTTTTAPSPTTTTTVPPTTAPATTAPAPGPVPPEDGPAAVGWAPAMREVVVDILEDEAAAGAAADPAPAPPAGPEAPVPPAGCPGTDPAAPPTGGPGGPPAQAPAGCPPASPALPPGEATGG